MFLGLQYNVTVNRTWQANSICQRHLAEAMITVPEALVDYEVYVNWDRSRLPCSGTVDGPTTRSVQKRGASSKEGNMTYQILRAV
jgi:hypothetical protein